MTWPAPTTAVTILCSREGAPSQAACTAVAADLKPPPAADNAAGATGAGAIDDAATPTGSATTAGTPDAADDTRTGAIGSAETALSAGRAAAERPPAILDSGAGRWALIAADRTGLLARLRTSAATPSGLVFAAAPGGVADADPAARATRTALRPDPAALPVENAPAAGPADTAAEPDSEPSADATPAACGPANDKPAATAATLIRAALAAIAVTGSPL